MKRNLFLLFVLILCLILPATQALSGRGCCSRHGGVAQCDCASGRYQCRDGTISPSCTCDCGQQSQPKQASPQAATTSTYPSPSNSPTSSSTHKHHEKYYQERWCNEQGGQIEVVLADGTRCDCLTKDYAVEFDFGPKWAEAIGQSLYYSIQTGKTPGIGLILESQNDYKYWIRLNTIIDHFKLPIKTWQVGEASSIQ